MNQGLEEIIGYKFQNHALLKQALTHPSVGYEHDRSMGDNQRLEFLGDAALQLALSTILFERLPTADEGRLTKLRSTLVSTRALAKLAGKLSLQSFLIIGKGEEANGGRNRQSTMADALEAVLGAVYLDAGFESLRLVTLALFGDLIADQEGYESEENTNPKGHLQELIQSFGAELPIYQIEQETGPAHDRRFVASVTWMEHRLGEGIGPTKKQAEIEAARTALLHPMISNKTKHSQ